ncbi:MAG: hypothetical protein LW870_08330 [Pirellula sp.]|nr:hypothetical protein [Pirellula sp.]
MMHLLKYLGILILSVGWQYGHHCCYAAAADDVEYYLTGNANDVRPSRIEGSLMLSSGKQFLYVDYWKGTPVQEAIHADVLSGFSGGRVWFVVPEKNLSPWTLG